VGTEWRIQGSKDHLHLEWSTDTIHIIIALCTAFAKAKISAPRKLSNARFLSENTNLNSAVTEKGQVSDWDLVLKFDINNTNVFVCNNYNGKL